MAVLGCSFPGDRRGRLRTLVVLETVSRGGLGGGGLGRGGVVEVVVARGGGGGLGSFGRGGFFADEPEGLASLAHPLGAVLRLDVLASLGVVAVVVPRDVAVGQVAQDEGRERENRDDPELPPGGGGLRHARLLIVVIEDDLLDALDARDLVGQEQRVLDGPEAGRPVVVEAGVVDLADLLRRIQQRRDLDLQGRPIRVVGQRRHKHVDQGRTQDLTVQNRGGGFRHDSTS